MARLTIDMLPVGLWFVVEVHVGEDGVWRCFIQEACPFNKD